MNVHPFWSIIVILLDELLQKGYDPNSGANSTNICDPAAGDNFLAGAEAPEIPDADGLTNSEFELVASKAQDPYLDPQERANAAMMMIFGTRRKCTLLQVYSSKFLTCRVRVCQSI